LLVQCRYVELVYAFLILMVLLRVALVKIVSFSPLLPWIILLYAPRWVNVELLVCTSGLSSLLTQDVSPNDTFVVAVARDGNVWHVKGRLPTGEQM